MKIQNDYWGNLIINIHADQLIASILLLVLLIIVLTLACTYKHGFVQWFKDYL